MSRTKLLAIVTALSLSASVYACGSDDDSTNSGNEAGTGGSTGGKAGSGGKSGASNTAGKGGNGGKAGATSGGGDAGTTSAAGEGGVTGVAGDTAITAGDTGSGGDNGGGGAPEGGSGGDLGAAGAGTDLNLTDACTATCAPAHSLTSCTTALADCIASCTGYPDLADIFAADADTADRLKKEYLAAVQCSAARLPDTVQYACAAQPAPPPAPPATVNLWSPVDKTVCETSLCKWTCDDGVNGTFSVDNDVLTRCACP